MIHRARKRAVSYLLAALSLAVANTACSDDLGAVPPVTEAGADAASLVDGGSGGTDAGPDAADGGITSPDAQVHAKGLGLAAGASFSKSANYRMVWTLGEGAGTNVASTSPKYRILRGVAGATATGK